VVDDGGVVVWEGGVRVETLSLTTPNAHDSALITVGYDISIA